MPLSAPPSLQRLDSDVAIEFARLQHVLLLIGKAPVRDSSFELFARHMGALAREAPGDAGLLYVIAHEQSPQPGTQGRLAMAIRQFEPQLRRMALVVEARGFAAAVQRSIATAVTRLAGIHGKMRIESEVAPGCRWVAEASQPDGLSVDRFVRSACAFRDEVVATIDR